jgi:tRNA threonylcarbamoyladenosine biosynthesis protein TsaE
VTSLGATQTCLLGELLGELAPAGFVVLLSGELGAGKTCFAKGVARGLAVPATTPVTSPSYALMNIYQGRLHLYHFDLYRLSRVEDLEDLGYDEHAEAGGVTLVEWADRISEPPESSLLVSIEHVCEDQRRLHFQASNQAGEALLASIAEKWSVAVVGA